MAAAAAAAAAASEVDNQNEDRSGGQHDGFEPFVGTWKAVKADGMDEVRWMREPGFPTSLTCFCVRGLTILHTHSSSTS